MLFGGTRKGETNAVWGSKRGDSNAVWVGEVNTEITRVSVILSGGEACIWPLI